MKKKTIKWLLILFALLAAGFAILNMLAYNHAHAMMHYTSGGLRTHNPEQLSFAARLKILFVGVNVPRPASDKSTADLALDCQTLTIPGPDKVTLSAWYVDRGDKTPLVILFHGYAADKTAMLREARIFLALGASVLLVDFRGSGNSSETYTTMGVREADDVAAITRHALNNFSHSSYILFGQSMGAVAILGAVYKHSISPDAVILEAVFDTMLNTVRNRFATMGIPSFPSAQLLVFWGGMQWGFNGFAHNPVDYARSLACPALFMHGSKDPRTKAAEGRRVFNAVTGSKEFIEFKDAGHEAYTSIYPKEWQTAVAEIIRKAEQHKRSTSSPRPL